MVNHISDENFKDEVASGVSLVDFYADWCGPCRMIAPMLEDLAKEFAGKAKLVKLNVDESQKVSADYAVSSIPTLILFKDGQEMQRIVGVRDEEFLREMIQSHL
jgi:thioredoxin 1